MAYIEAKYNLGDVIEVEKYHSGRFGKRGNVTEKKSKTTPEQMKKINIRNKGKYLRRLIKINFKEGDIYMTLTYSRENRTDVRTAKKNLNNFIRSLKRWYKKNGSELKYIIVTEYENVAIHHHIIINNIDSQNVPQEVNRLWKYGRPDYKFLDNGNYEKLANYLIKETEKSMEKGRHSYTPSRNLKKPEKKITIMKAKEWRKEPKAPKGYYLDKSSLFEGVSEVTGYRYQYYSLIKIKDQKGGKRGEG